MLYQFRPLGAWLEGDTYPRRSRYAFKAKWSSTLILLDRELGHLNAERVVVQADFREQDLRLDGMPRSSARTPQHPGVRLSFASKHGSLTYATDAYEVWEHNVRAIALGLEALRAVDRYGVTRRGEQYTGWKALSAGASDMSESEALTVLHRHAPERKHNEPLPDLFRWAKAGAHPDRHGGDHSHWEQVEQAGRVLGLA